MLTKFAGPILNCLCKIVLLSILLVCFLERVTSASAASEGASTLAAAAPVPDAPLPDPCKLLTKEEAQAVLGEPVRDPEPSSIAGTKICDYKSLKLYGGVMPLFIHIAIASEKKNVWDAGKKLHTPKEMRAVAGLGDDAYFLLDALDILSKERFITIEVMKNIDKPDHAKAVEEAEKKVAEEILPRLDKTQ